MEKTRARQVDRARKVTGKSFVMQVASIVLRLAIAQLICNVLIMRTGKGIFNILFYGYAIWLLLKYMRRTVAGYCYTLKEDVLVLERRLGDSTTSVVEIPLEKVVSVRPVYAAERLKVSYKQVTVIDPAAAPSARMKLAFLLSLLSARLARKAAGKGFMRKIGYVVVFDELSNRRACVFRPNEEMCKALEEAVGSRWLLDERLNAPKVDTLAAKALQRAFPGLYPQVEPLITEKDMAWAAREKKRRARKKRDTREAVKTQAAHSLKKKTGTDEDRQE